VFLGNGLGTPVAPENSRSFAALESREWIAAAALTTDGRRATGVSGTVGCGSVGSERIH